MANVKNKVIDRVREVKSLCKTYYDMNVHVQINTHVFMIYGKILSINDEYIYLEAFTHGSYQTKKIKIHFIEIEGIIPIPE